MNYLLDTNAVSELSKEHPNARVVAWVREHSAECYLSTITLGELIKGLESLPEGKRQRMLAREIQFIQDDYHERILAYDELAAVQWGRLYAAASKANRLLPLEDSLIEAIALSHSLTVVTRNPQDFFRVTIFNPWIE